MKASQVVAGDQVIHTESKFYHARRYLWSVSGRASADTPPLQDRASAEVLTSPL